MARRPMRLNVKKGALHRQLGIPQGKPIPTSTLQRLKNSSNPLTRRRANFALNARGWRHVGRHAGGRHVAHRHAGEDAVMHNAVGRH